MLNDLFFGFQCRSYRRVRVWGLASRIFGNGAGKEMPESRCFNSCIELLYVLGN